MKLNEKRFCPLCKLPDGEAVVCTDRCAWYCFPGGCVVHEISSSLESLDESLQIISNNSLDE